MLILGGTVSPPFLLRFTTTTGSDGEVRVLHRAVWEFHIIARDLSCPEDILNVVRTFSTPSAKCILFFYRFYAVRVLFLSMFFVCKKFPTRAKYICFRTGELLSFCFFYH